MGESNELNCPYCDKKYINRGFLPKHITQYHENAQLLDLSNTVLQEAANDESCLAAGLNLSENPLWNELENSLPSEQTSTPTHVAPVPICENAMKYIIKRGNTLPASFLTALLPAPGFLNMLNESLQTPASPLLEALQPPASPRLEANQLSTNRMENLAPASPGLEVLQLPAGSQPEPPQHKKER